MNQELLLELDSFVRLYLVPTAWKLIGALAIWVIGGWAIRLIRVAFGRFMRLRRVDETIARYLDASAAVLLKLLTLIAVLGVLGIETTSFAALLAAVGLAIGAAWSGLLANFAAGLFLKLFMDNVQNFSANSTRRVDLTAQALTSTDLETVVNRLVSVTQIPNVLDQPPPRVEILTFSAAGPVLTVRPYCRNEHYWQVYFDTNRAISHVCVAGAGH